MRYAARKSIHPGFWRVARVGSTRIATCYDAGDADKVADALNSAAVGTEVVNGIGPFLTGESVEVLTNIYDDVQSITQGWRRARVQYPGRYSVYVKYDDDGHVVRVDAERLRKVTL